MKNPFDLSGKVVIITGAAGFLGKYHAEAVANFGGTPILLDLFQEPLTNLAAELNDKYHVNSVGFTVDITSEAKVSEICKNICDKFSKIDVLINNAANNPKVDSSNIIKNTSRVENFPLDIWQQDIAVGLTGSFLCAKYFGHAMAQSGGGSIINISSDLGIIAPDQRLYREDGIPESMQNVKPITYSVVKTGLIGLTRYLATYWAEQNVRCNALCPGGVLAGQGEEFLSRINRLIPMGRMANPDELQGAIIFLASEASLYMNGSVLVIDGGRSVW